jgi:hypothetical protein
MKVICKVFHSAPYFPDQERNSRMGVVLVISISINSPGKMSAVSQELFFGSHHQG